MRCKHPECNMEFTPKHRRHYFCSEQCKYTHHNHTETHLEGMRIFNRSPKGKIRTRRFLQTERGRRYNANKQARQRQRYPDRCIARIIAAREIEKLGYCTIPGCGELGEKHHPDYSKPLEVVYLCKKHHAELRSKELNLAYT